MILDMNINLAGIDEEFLDELDDFIEDTRVEYFIVNPKTKEEVQKSLEIASKYQRFKYILPLEFLNDIDKNCVAIRINNVQQIDEVSGFSLVIDSKDLNDEFIELINKGLTPYKLHQKYDENDYKHIIDFQDMKIGFY